MNIIRVCGGLGNQLFQYAFGKTQEANGIEVLYNLAWYARPQIPARPYLLDKFNIPSIKSIDTRRRPRQAIKKEKTGLNLLFLNYDNCYFVGYWQSPLYFHKILPQLQKEFQLQEKFHTPDFKRLKEKMLVENSVALHVRRGDYLEKEAHLVLPLDYYDRALKIINTLKGKTSVYVFSDDISWCKKNFKNCTFISLDICLDFELMQSCKYHITANSTFSWWAAYLSKSELVITPKIWVKDEKAQLVMDQKQFLLPSWIKL